jgi:hypothetical protein
MAGYDVQTRRLKFKVYSNKTHRSGREQSKEVIIVIQMLLTADEDAASADPREQEAHGGRRVPRRGAPTVLTVLRGRLEAGRRHQNVSSSYVMIELDLFMEFV